MKLGLAMEEYQGLQTHLNLRRDFTGRFQDFVWEIIIVLRPTSQDRSSSSFPLGHFPTEEETQKSVF